MAERGRSIWQIPGRLDDRCAEKRTHSGHASSEDLKCESYRTPLNNHLPRVRALETGIDADQRVPVLL